MKSAWRIWVLILLALALSLPQVARAQGPTGDKYVFGGTYHLKTDEVLQGNLFVFGGVATLEEGSTVQGDVLLATGTLKVNGKVEGSIVSIAGLVNLGEPAVVTGDVASFIGRFNRENGARILGKLSADNESPFNVLVQGGGHLPSIEFRPNPLWEVLTMIFGAFLWAAVAVLVVLFAQYPAQRVSEAAIHQPIIAGGLGLLTVLVSALVLLVFAITIIGLPISVLGVALLALGWAFGLIAIGTEVGRRITTLFHTEWALPAAAGVGTLLLMLVLDGADQVIPCIGWLFKVAIGMIGLGAVLLTRLGTQPYPPPLSPAGPMAEMLPPPPGAKP